jgi:hypothetical protein
MFYHGLLISADSKLWYLCVPLALHDNRWNRQGSSSDDHRRRCLPVSPWIWWVPEECLHVSEWVHLPWNSWFARAEGRASRSFLLHFVVHFLAVPLSWKNNACCFLLILQDGDIINIDVTVYLNVRPTIFVWVIWLSAFFEVYCDVLLQGYHATMVTPQEHISVERSMNLLSSLWRSDLLILLDTSNHKFQIVTEQLVWCNRSLRSVCWGAYQPANMVLASRQLERE